MTIHGVCGMYSVEGSRRIMWALHQQQQAWREEVREHVSRSIL
jgi:hypothetical protein